jgi:hypothetical protein
MRQREREDPGYKVKKMWHIENFIMLEESVKDDIP